MKRETSDRILREAMALPEKPKSITVSPDDFLRMSAECGSLGSPMGMKLVLMLPRGPVDVLRGEGVESEEAYTEAHDILTEWMKDRSPTWMMRRLMEERP